MIDLKQLYAHRVAMFALGEQKLRKKRNAITLSKVICFCMLVYSLWKFATCGTDSRFYFLTGFLFLVVVYVWLSIYDSRIWKTIQHFSALVKCSRLEAEYLKGDYSQLPTGEMFSDLTHPYSNDLDIFGQNSIFQEINRTATYNGSVKLSEILKTNCKDPDEIILRQEAAGELAANLELCHSFRAAGMNHPIAELNGEIITKWLKKESFFRKVWFMPLIWGLNAAMACTLVGMVFYGFNIGYFACLFLTQLSLAMYRAYYINVLSAELGTFIKALSNYIYLTEIIKDKSFKSKKLKQIHTEIFGKKDAIRAFKKLKQLEGALDSRMNLIVLVGLNGLYARDLHTIFRLERWKKEYLSQVPHWVTCISNLDAYISMANYRFNHPEFIVPQIHREAPDKISGFLSATQMGHPLLHSDQVITNDFHLSSLHNFYVITGANMAGKSTFLRAVGVNLVLAMSGNPVFATEFTFAPISLFTSMRTTDNLAKGTSYFHAELLRLKELVDTALQEPLFIILDEMLKGTNSRDKLNGSIRFLEKLLTLPVCGIIATHDLALGELQAKYPENFCNRCFEIEHSADDIRYDYKLKEGVSRNMNASLLLKKMGLIG